MTAAAELAQNALLNLLLPVWQVVIGLFVVAAVVVGTVRLARRGPSRTTAALMLVGAVLLGVCVLSLLLERL